MIAGPNPYLTKFNDHYNKHHNIAQAISGAVSLFLKQEHSSQGSAAPKDLREELKNYLKVVKTARLGRIVNKRTFSNALPGSLTELFNVVALIEQGAFCAPNALISDCENQIAAGQSKPLVVYQQAVRIEAAKVAKEFEQRHLFSANSKLAELIAALYGSFAELIFESTDIKSLKESVEAVFSKALVENLPKLKEFRV